MFGVFCAATTLITRPIVNTAQSICTQGSNGFESTHIRINSVKFITIKGVENDI